MQEEDGRFGYKFDPGWFGLPSRPKPELDHVVCPTVQIRGGESTLLTEEAATKFVSQLRLGRFVEIAEAGHHVLIDQPERLIVQIETFIRSVEDGES